MNLKKAIFGSFRATMVAALLLFGSASLLSSAGCMCKESCKSKCCADQKKCPEAGKTDGK